jgi:ABC-type transport system involved in cytochrome bd biosynthesis fused ATPase/permease subunit
MWGALREAGLDEVIALAGGLDAEISVLGEGFSGGEARRLALARAFISERPMLLLDEPSEGLDAEAEARIASAIRDYVDARPGRLAVVVTHRAALGRIGDTCVDLDAGGTASVH